MKKIVTFGEILLRLSTDKHLRFSQSQSYLATFGGGEFNVAVSLANFGLETDFVTKLPDNDLGNCVMQELRKLNVNSNNIIKGGDRLGIYFLETGTGARSSSVIYDRAHSAMSAVAVGEFNWKEIFKDCNWFHWTGITPALSQSAANACFEAIKVAHELGLTISTDLNYRAKLWNYGKHPNEIMPEMLKYSTVILGDIDTANYMLGLNQEKPDYENVDALPQLYNAIFNKCSNLKIIATTLRYSVSASHQKIGGILYNGKKIIKADIQEVNPVLDRVGSGDAFMGGLIYCLHQDPLNTQKALNFAVAACCLKHTIFGDYNLTTKTEIEKLLDGDFTGKVSR